MPAPSPSRKKRLVAIDAALALIVVLLIVQMWLLSATLGAFLSGHRAAALPGALVSVALFAGCAALAGFIHRLDRS